jgi:hypothetical protein
MSAPVFQEDAVEFEGMLVVPMSIETAMYRMAVLLDNWKLVAHFGNLDGDEDAKPCLS